MFGPIPGMDFLGSTVLGSAAVTTGALTVDARDILFLLIRVTGYSGSDIASLRFNGDTGANYWVKKASSVNSTTAWTVVAASAPTSPNGLVSMFSTGVNTGRLANVTISNNLATEKIGVLDGTTGTGSTAGGTIEKTHFGWVNTTAQITSIEMRTAGGTITLSAGSGFAVFGRNF